MAKTNALMAGGRVAEAGGHQAVLMVGPDVRSDAVAVARDALELKR